MAKKKLVDKTIALTEAKGIEKTVLFINKNITRVENALERVFEGKPLPPNTKHKNPLDYGLVSITQQVAAVDLCNIFTYAINKIPSATSKIISDAKKTNGNTEKRDGTTKQEKQKTEFEKALNYIQDRAYEGQILIDKYYSEFADSDNLTARTGLLILCRNLKIKLNTSSDINLIIDSSVTKAFPQLSAYNNFIENALKYFDSFGNDIQIPANKLEKVKKYIEKTRGILIAIQAFDISDPSRLLSLGLASLPDDVKRDIEKINKIVKPDRLLPFLVTLTKKCVELQNLCNYFIGVIRKAQTLISSVISGIKILQTLKSFIISLLNAIPNVFTTLGLNITTQEITTTKLDKLIENIIKRLNQLNVILLRCISIVEYTISQIDIILQYIRIIIANLESCNNVNPSIINDLKNTADSLQSTVNALNNFKNNYEGKVSNLNNTIGDRKNKYTIKIITEQLTDEAISIKRRYGIAIDKYKAIVASSTPTFASDDNVIVQEVQLILVSKGLINPEASSLSPESLATVNRALFFLEDDNLTLNELESQILLSEGDLDDPNNSNENSGIGLNAFINNLSGGKKLRDRVRARLTAKISANSAINPSSATNISNIVGSNNNQKTESQYDKNAKIQDLQNKREKLVKERQNALKLGPAGITIASVKTKQISDIDKEIAKLKG